MESQLAPLEFCTDGFVEFGDRVPLRAVAEALAALAVALDAITSKLSEREPAVSWVIQEARIGSFSVAIEPQPHVAVGSFIADETVRMFTLAVDADERGEDIEELVPKATASSIRRLRELVESGASQPIFVRRGELEASFHPSRVIEALPEKYQSLGSIEGELTTISFAGAPYFTVRTRLDRVSVRCTLDPDRFFDEVIEVIGSLRHRVRVTGLVTKGRDGVPTALAQVSAIVRFAADADLPQPSDMLGIDPHLTNGQPSDFWIRNGRDEAR